MTCTLGTCFEFKARENMGGCSIYIHVYVTDLICDLILKPPACFKI